MSTCPNLKDGVCAIATSIAGEAVYPCNKACESCAGNETPRAINMVTVGLAIERVVRSGKSPERITRDFGHVLQAKKTFPTKVISYAKAVAQWVAQGFPVREEEEVQRLFYSVCKKCPLRQETSQEEVLYCKSCGCVLSPDPSIQNKLFFENQHCPLGKF